MAESVEPPKPRAIRLGNLDGRQAVSLGYGADGIEFYGTHETLLSRGIGSVQADTVSGSTGNFAARTTDAGAWRQNG
ncbi:hypothetical protein CE91St30_06450 [Raoultibacter timonensis]|uniref:Uncharacterized protein n=1 Tax=Raoultibacter timonensis TaxID=1907662 RepID=A0ABN6MBB3_9ACTN|nr:hypothetical protein CE91St30_06450 [Raoultibacter timonensis]BDF49915.1 hypothetical protein CE91St31_06450 [Raoultibacter timonensis]